MRLITFSGTGNSLEVAHRIAASFPDATVESVLQLQRAEGPIVLSGMVGFVFPIHMNGVPRPLIRMNWEQDITPEHVERMQRRLDDAMPGINAAIAARTHGHADRYRSERKARGSLTHRLIWRLAAYPRGPATLNATTVTRVSMSARNRQSASIITRKRRGVTSSPAQRSRCWQPRNRFNDYVGD